ncbi:MAG: hypothetical protein O3C63_05715 [Cyanobacteria bacterium]|nr:hypothetical protein [Cyanobacteriota bacterium]MDA1021464.1 hypothetical protein [Cyanobacteriota bacterium]
MAKAIEFEIGKYINELKGIDDVLYDPRSWSPESLTEACNNLEFLVTSGDYNDRPGFEFEFVVLQYLFRRFFYLAHQTGLYNPQRKLWALLAQTKKVKIKDYKIWSRTNQEHTRISDIKLQDHNGFYIKARIVHPGSLMEMPGLKPLLRVGSKKCLGLFYFSQQEPNEKLLKKIKAKTNASDPFDRFKAPIKEASLNIVRYQVESGKFAFKLIYPDLGKDIVTHMDFANKTGQAAVGV